MESVESPPDKRRRPSNDPYKKTALACNRCRHRKQKCLGEAPIPCSACEQAGLVCIYTEAEKRIAVPEGYLLDLEARVQRYAGEGAMLGRATSPPRSHISEGEEIDEYWLERMEKLTVSPSGQHRFTTASSSSNMGMDLHKVMMRKPDLAMELQMTLDSPSYNDSSWLRRPSNATLPELPPKEYVSVVFEKQYLYIGTIFSFCQRRDFEKRLDWVYSRSAGFSGREECLTWCQILLIIAYGQLYSLNQWSGNDGPPGFPFFKQALKCLPEIHEEGSVLFVEVLSLIGYFMQNLNRRDAAFLYIGLALRMAISLGLHREVTDTSLSDYEKEHRRRVWWSVYSMDRILCVKSGNPITIEDEDIDVALPTPVPGLEINPFPARTLSHYTQLSRILGNIGEDIYRRKRKTGRTLIASVQSIMSDLANWLREMPPELRLDFSKLDVNISRESVSTYLHYFQCVNLTARPVLYHVVRRRLEDLSNGIVTVDWKEGLSSNTVAAIQNSLAAARASTVIMNAAAKQDLVATYGFMDGEHAFSAALVLVMVNIAFPYNSRDAHSMNSALTVLTRMADRGNTHVKARQALLMNLLSSGKASCADEAFEQSENLALQTQKSNSGPGINPSSSTDTTQPSTSPNESGILQGISFDFNTNDDNSLWEEVWDRNISTDMDFGWLETALRDEGSLI